MLSTEGTGNHNYVKEYWEQTMVEGKKYHYEQHGKPNPHKPWQELFHRIRMKDPLCSVVLHSIGIQICLLKKNIINIDITHFIQVHHMMRKLRTRMSTYRNWDPFGDNVPLCANPMTHYYSCTQRRKAHLQTFLKLNKVNTKPRKFKFIQCQCGKFS